MNVLSELAAWLGDLEPVFLFLLALPLVVAAVGLLAEAQRTRGVEPAPADPDAHRLAHRTPVRAP